MVLLTRLLMTMSGDPAYLFVGPATSPSLPGGLPVADNAGERRLLAVLSGSPDLPVALINCWVDRVETSNFGSVKSLYR